jgi:hypothetical protein
MRYLTFIKGEQTPAVGVLLSDSLHILDLSHVSCSDIIGGAGSNLLEMVMAGLPSITKKITSKIESGHYDQAAVVIQERLLGQLITLQMHWMSAQWHIQKSLLFSSGQLVL